MHAERTHHIDASEQDANGLYEYYYEYDIYRLSEGEVCFIARSYIDEPDSAHFLRIEAAGTARLITIADLKSSEFLAALKHLQSEGKRKLSWLSEKGYMPLPPAA